jgi:hypothetical protein
MSLFDTGIRPTVDAHLQKLAEEKRDYGNYWSASSAGYCMRRNIFERLKVPYVSEDARKTRVFAVGDVFHEWMQRITKEAGLSIAQELELQDEELMIRGHIDDLVLIKGGEDIVESRGGDLDGGEGYEVIRPDKLILYDYKSQSSRAFSYKRPNMSYFHRLQLATYMYMLRKRKTADGDEIEYPVSESRICKISKDDLRMTEEQLLWSDELEQEVLTYWKTLNKYWADKKLLPCTCADHEGGFLAKEKYNPFFYKDEPCSIEWYLKWKEEQKDAN